MLRVVQLALLALLLTSSSLAWVLPQNIEGAPIDDGVSDNNCSSYNYEAWLELLPQPVFIDAMPGSEPEEAEEVEDYEEPEGNADPDYDQSDSESTDDLDDDVQVHRKKRDASSEEEGRDSDEKKSRKEGKKDSDDESDEEDDDNPYAFLKLKASHTTGGLLHPGSLAKVMLKNFQKARMSFFMKIEPFRAIDECKAGRFSSHFFFLKLKGCWLEHKHKAHKICKKNHGHHGRNHQGDHQHGHNHHGGHQHDHNHHGDHNESRNYHSDHDEGRNHHGRSHYHSRHARDADELEDNDDNITTTNSADDSVEDDSTFKFPRHGFMEPADGEAASCNNTVEGWLEPESAIFVPYTTPSCGCIVISAFVGYPIANGSLVLTAEGNAEFLQHMDCVQPNPTPEDDDLEYYDYEASNDISTDDHVDLDGIDTSNIIEDDVTRSPRGRSGLRSQRRRSKQNSDEDDDSNEDDSDDENTTIGSRRGRGGSYSRLGRDDEDDDEVYRGRRSPDDSSMNGEEGGDAQSRRNERRLEKQRKRAERREARQQRRQGGGGGGGPSPAEEDAPMPTDEEIANIDDPRELRRVMKMRRRHMRRLRDRAENSEHRGSGDAASEATAEDEEGGRRRGRKGKRQQQEGQGQNRQLIRDLTEPGARFCCKQGIQHKKASTYPEEDGTLPQLQCDSVPAEIPTWASHKHTIQSDVCGVHYTDCCNRFNIDAWKTWKERAASRRESRQSRRKGGRDEE